MMRAKLSTCAFLLAIAAPIYAETALPSAGMNMQAVESQFGKPASKSSPVGHPPITRWDYGDYVVVFERSSVVNSVRIVRTAGGATVTAPSPVAPPAPAAAPAAVTPAAAPKAPAPVAAEPAKSGTKATVTVTVKPVEAAAAPEVTAPAGSSGEVNVQQALDKATAEKTADGTVTTPAVPEAPAPAPAPADAYTFDPETGRIIIK
ncbi:MAG: hypothetical protein K0S46_588 [Moraxellaceae bacterium]|jgi:hypothetical protein|nr:hypothetical protein [Moraxellaceae bacterium]